MTTAPEFALASLSPKARGKILAVALPVTFEEGQQIFREGDRAINLYVLTRGRIALEAHTPPHGTKIFATAEPGEWFSWSALIGPRLETATARALEPSAALAIKGGVLLDLCLEDPELGFEVYRMLADVIAERLIASRLQMLDVFAAG
ncbi:MAG TPA: cyclic nucleotide-binding domain-containing protein [Thermoanaerobaculia bacterium]|nr:cyclic nucleotide-binding domain-containing protein [Thermoanaerobaculia bacterium]